MDCVYTCMLTVHSCRRLGDTAQLQNTVPVCIDEVVLWMRSNRLHIDAGKLHTSARRQHQIRDEPVSMCSDAVTPVRSVRDLGIYVDCDLSMSTHAMRTVTSCFVVMRKIHNIR